MKPFTQLVYAALQIITIATLVTHGAQIPTATKEALSELDAAAKASDSFSTSKSSIEPTVRIKCLSGSMLITIKDAPLNHETGLFSGMIYPKGLSKNSTCLTEYRDHDGPLRYKLPLRSCNTMPQETVNMDVDMPAAPTPTTRSAVNVPRQAAAPVAAAPVAAPRTTTPTAPRNGRVALPPTPALVVDPQRRRCPLCRRPHRLPQCVIFKGLPPQQRQLVVQAHGHCLNCLTPVHQTHECTSGNLCQMCMRPHHTMLHRTPRNGTSQPPAGRNRGAVQRPPLSRDARPRRTIGPSSSRARRPHNGASTRRQQQRPRPRHTSGLSSVVATLQQLQRILG